MTRGPRYCCFAFVLWLTACGGSTPPAAAPSTPPTSATDSTSEVAPLPSAAPSSDVADSPSDAPSSKPQKEDAPEPVFTPNMSVEEAIKAIPQSAERVNVDDETLSKPLQDEALFEPCKPGSAHFTMRVAVWRGKAVAIDLNTTPKNAKLAACLKDRVLALTWSVKVPSLNTVSYSM